MTVGGVVLLGQGPVRVEVIVVVSLLVRVVVIQFVPIPSVIVFILGVDVLFCGLGFFSLLGFLLFQIVHYLYPVLLPLELLKRAITLWLHFLQRLGILVLLRIGSSFFFLMLHFLLASLVQQMIDRHIDKASGNPLIPCLLHQARFLFPPGL